MNNPLVKQSTGTFQQTYHTGVFPAFLENHDKNMDIAGAVTWVRENKTDLTEMMLDSGTVFFRGFPVKTAEDFDAFFTAFGLPAFTYKESLSNAVRVNKTPKVFTANEAPPEAGIFLHHEMAQTPIYPSKLFFFCEIAAGEGGATPICRSDILLERLTKAEPEFVQKCRDLGVRYSIVMPASDDPASGQGRGWQSTLGVASKPEAEKRLTDLGYSFAWLKDDSLRTTTPTLPAIRTAENGREAYFNQLIAAFKGWQDVSYSGVHKIAFGDGEPLPDEAMNTVCEIAEELSVDTPWQSGDIVFIDNFQVMHGRRSFKGKRRVLTAFAGKTEAS